MDGIQIKTKELAKINQDNANVGNWKAPSTVLMLSR